MTTPVVTTVLTVMPAPQFAWPVRIAALGRIAAGTTLWRFGGQLMITVIAKARFALVADAEMQLVDPEPLQTSEEHAAGQAMGSVRRTSECAPQLPRVDVLLWGHAHPPERGATQSTVRLSIRNHGGTVLDKLAFVMGHRDATGALSPLEPITLGYERAYGGIGFSENPLGVGFGAHATTAPNLVDPRDPTRVASFSAIPSAFPMRKRLLGSLPKSALSQRIVELPAKFDWAYFQAAPNGQQLASLRGGEWVVLEGVFADRPKMQSRLPELRAVAKVHAPRTTSALPEFVPLIIDTLALDADQQICQVIWRGSFPLHDEALIDELVIATALESDREPVRWPSVAQLEPAAAPSRAATAEDQAETQVRDATPALDGTVTLDVHGAATPAVPQGRGATRAAPKSALEGTVALGAAEHLPQAVVPFKLAPATSDGSRPSAAVPGAPWSQESAAKVMAPQRGEDTLALVDPAEQQNAIMQARRQLEEREQRALEATAARAAAEEARRDAEERSRLEAAKFRAEQERARREAERRLAEKAKEKREHAADVKRNLYAGLKKKP